MQTQIFFSGVSVLISAAIAIASWFIARRQVAASEDKLRLDLYDKRFQVYSRAVDFYQALASWSSSDEDRTTHRLFLKSKLESQFLFPGSEIPETLEKMHKEAFKVIGLKEHGKEIHHPPTYIEFYERGMAGLSAFDLGVNELQSKMAPYLNFDQMKRGFRISM
jgi:hypothetical protein